MKVVLVTGGTGLLGAHLISNLMLEGFVVHALVRDRSKLIFEASENLRLFTGDLSDRSILSRAMANCHFVIHSAAETRQNLIHYADYHHVNVLSTNTLLDAAMTAGVKRFIHVSTSNVFGHGDLCDPGIEGKAAGKPFLDSLYVRSKIEAHHCVLSFADQIEVITVHPTFLIGAFDQKPSSGSIILYGWNKKVLCFPPGGKSFVSADWVSKAIIALLESGSNKEAYLLSGENLTYEQFFSKLSSLNKHKVWLLQIPKMALLAAGVLGSAMRLFGVRVSLSYNNAKILCTKNFYSNEKIVKELGIKPEDIESSLQDAITWFKASGKIRE